MLKKLFSLCVVSSLSLLAISCASSKVVVNQEYKNPSHSAQTSIKEILFDTCSSMGYFVA